MLDNIINTIFASKYSISKKNKKPVVGVLAFEISGAMSKLLHIWRSSSEESVARLLSESIKLEGVRRIVSTDEAFLLGLACAEMVETLCFVAGSVSWISRNCSQDSNLRSFDHLFNQFADSGYDPHNWLVGSREIQPMIRRMERFVTATADLHREMSQLSMLEDDLKKLLQCKETRNSGTIEWKHTELQQSIYWKKQQVKSLKAKSLWSRSFDTVTLLLVRCVFTILARIKLAFGSGQETPMYLPRSVSSSGSALIHPCENVNSYETQAGKKQDGFFELNRAKLKPALSTLGAAALSLHYANLIIVIERMIGSPNVIGPAARDSLYAMLPSSIRCALRARLKGYRHSARNPVLAAEWRKALHRILVWLSPLAHNMIVWQSERSIEHQLPVPKTNVLLLQTLCFANQEKTEATITELLIGLNCIWRFERQMNAKC